MLIKLFRDIVVSILVFISTIHCEGQGLTIIGASLRVSDSATLFIYGDLISHSKSHIQNEGSIFVTGNWTNHADSRIFRKQSGNVLFPGATHILGGDSQTIFNNLVFPDSGATRLERDITCTGTLNLNDHRIFLNGHRLNLTNPSRESLHFKNGCIISERPFGSSISLKTESEQGLRTIPFGTSEGAAIPVFFELKTKSETTLLFSTYATNDLLEPIPKINKKIISPVSSSIQSAYQDAVKRYWILESMDTSIIAHLEFSYTSDEGDTNQMDKLTVISWDDTSETWKQMAFFETQGQLPSCLSPVNQSIFSLVATSPTVIRNSLTFTAFPDAGQQIITRWYVVKAHADAYQIEKSRDGIRYENVDQTISYQLNKETGNFELRDPNPYPGYSWYRLNQFLKGTFLGTTEPVRVFIIRSGEVKVNFYPNPVQTTAIIQIQAESIPMDELVFELIDNGGKTVLSKFLKEMDQKDSHLYEFTRGNLRPGLYAFRLLSSDKNLKTGKIIIE